MSASRIIPSVEARQPTDVELNEVFKAAENGDVGIVEQLYASGLVNLNKPRKPGCDTPAHVAAVYNHADIITLFHKKGECNLSVWNHDGMTPACLAARKGHVSVIEALLAARVDLEQANRDGNTPLHLAVFSGGGLAVASRLRDAGVNLNIPNYQGVTPAMAAIDCGWVDGLKALLEWGVDCLERTAAGYTLLEYARLGYAARHIRLLESHYQALNIPLPALSMMQIDMPAGWKNAESYRKGFALNRDKFYEKFTHVVHHVTKIAPTREPSQSSKYTSIWFEKQAHNRIRAQREVFAQELFRLFIPGQPKTRLAVDSQNKTFVLSKGIPHYECISDVAIRISQASQTSELTQSTMFKSKQNGLKVISQGLSDHPDAPGMPPEYTQLAYIIIMSLWMHEYDFRLGNIGIELGKFRKIDGDYCFRGLELPHLKEAFRITPDLINGLPYVGSYYVMNWLDHVMVFETEPNPALVVDELHNKWFRKEINEIILKIILMPSMLLQRLAEHHMVKTSADQCMDFLLERAEQLREAALQNESFKLFMETPSAILVRNALIEQVSCFKMTKKIQLVDDADEISEKIHARFTALMNQLTHKQDALSRSNHD